MERDITVLNPASMLEIKRPNVPRFRATHEEIVEIDHDFGKSFPGYLVQNGVVRGLYASYSNTSVEGGDDDDIVEFVAGQPAEVWWPWVRRAVFAQEALLARDMELTTTTTTTTTTTG